MSTEVLILQSLQEGQVLCSRCRTWKDPSAFNKSKPNRNGLFGWCRECQSHAKRAKYATDPLHRAHQAAVGKRNRAKPHSKRLHYASHLRSKYGVDLATLEGMLVAQMGLCANRACGTELVLYHQDKRKRPYLDHDHATGKIRGVLCDACNKAVGFLRDNPNVVLGLAEYLSKGS